MFFVVSKLFTYLFLPPGIFVIILFLAAFFAKKAKKLFFFSALLLWALSNHFVSNALIYPLENGYKTDSITPTAVVVLGGGANPNDVLKAYPDAFKREVYAVLTAKSKNLPLIFTGGGIAKPTEAECVKKDIDLITSVCKCSLKSYYEEKSLNTYQNAEFTSRLFEKLGIAKKIYLVTSAYHMKRSIKLFHHFGFKVIPKPVGFFYNPKYTFWSIFPNAGDFYKSYRAVHEYFGLLSLKLRGI